MSQDLSVNMLFLYFMVTVYKNYIFAGVSTKQIHFSIPLENDL